MEGLILYKGRYGATAQYAAWLKTALKMPALPPEVATPEKIASADCILIGTSVYIGRLQITKWLRQHAMLLEGKHLIFFIVAGSAPKETEKPDAYYEHCVPASLRKTAIRFYLPGRLNFSRLSWKDKLLLRTGAWLAAKKGQKISMEDYDHVSEEALVPVVAAVRALDATSLNTQNAVV